MYREYIINKDKNSIPEITDIIKCSKCQTYNEIKYVFIPMQYKMYYCINCGKKNYIIKSKL